MIRFAIASLSQVIVVERRPLRMLERLGEHVVIRTAGVSYASSTVGPRATVKQQQQQPFTWRRKLLGFWSLWAASVPGLSTFEHFLSI